MLDEVRWLSFKTFADTRGRLSVLEGQRDVPFVINRLYYLYDSTSDRGAHAHKALEQVFICLKGECELELDDGVHRRAFTLSRPDEGLYLPPGLWRIIRLKDEDSLCLVLASHHYSESDYIRDYDEFLSFAKKPVSR